eukprot:g25351.t1
MRDLFCWQGPSARKKEQRPDVGSAASRSSLAYKTQESPPFPGWRAGREENGMGRDYRWIIVFAGGLMGCVAAGVMFSLAVFLGPIAEATGWSHASISSAMTLNFIVMGVGSFLWGALSDRYGTRIVVLIGAVLAGFALVMASRVQSLAAFQLAYGCLVGLSASAFMAPMISLTLRWFDTQRSLAVSLVSAGMGMAPMTVSPLARWLITETGDWRSAMMVIGIGAWAILLPCVLLVRDPPAQATGEDVGRPAEAAVPLRAIFRSPQFLALAFTFFACCAAHSGPIFHMVSYAMYCGVTPMAAVSIYSVEGAAGLGGRIVYGLLADRIGVKPVLIGGLLIQAAVIAAYVAVTDLAHFYLLAVIFGGTYGGVMPLYAVLARDYFGARIVVQHL